MNFRELKELKQLSEEFLSIRISFIIITCIKNIILIASYIWLCSVIIDSITNNSNIGSIVINIIFSAKNFIIMIIWASVIKYMINIQKRVYADKKDALEKIRKFFLNISK